MCTVYEIVINVQLYTQCIIHCTWKCIIVIMFIKVICTCTCNNNTLCLIKSLEISDTDCSRQSNHI